MVIKKAVINLYVLPWKDVLKEVGKQYAQHNATC